MDEQQAPNRAIIEQALAKVQANNTPMSPAPAAPDIMQQEVAPLVQQTPVQSLPSEELPPVIQPSSPITPEVFDVAAQENTDAYLRQKGALTPEEQVQAALPPEPLLTSEEINAIAQPTEQQVKAEINAVVAPVQKQRAEAMAMDRLAEMQREADERQALREQEANQKMQELDKKVRVQSFNEIFKTGSFGDKLLAGLSIALGGASQALTGARSNPVIDFMNQMVEQQAAQDRLTLQEKEMLRKQVFEAGQNEIRRLEQASNNAYRRDNLALQQRELNAKIGEINAKLMAEMQKTVPNDMFSGRELTPEEVLKARSDKNLARSVVQLPNGKSFLATNASDATEFKKYASQTFAAIKNLEQYKDLLTVGTSFSLVDRGRADALAQAIVGALRLPLTGPGVLTDTEREQLLKAIGTYGITRLPPVEQAKARQIIDVLKTGTVNEARLRGISGDVFPETYYKLGERAVKEDDLVKAYKTKMPSLSDQQIKSAIQKQIPKL